MDPIVYIDRVSGKKETEQVYGAAALKFLYGDDFLSKIFGAPALHLASRLPFFSSLYGWWQNRPASRRKIVPFIKEFGLDASEFAKPVEEFSSFNDFFVRKLKPEARPIASEDNAAIIPADGRYWFYEDISKVEGFVIKDEKFCLKTLLDDPKLASEYANASMVMARLCPTDYHRYHFPCDCTPSDTRFINGWLYSVNPVAVRKDIHIFAQNKRTLCELQTKSFGKVLFLEIGATSVGSINQTYTPDQPHSKGDEKGYFSFGASALIILFSQKSIVFDEDLLDATRQGYEIRCLKGQRMGQQAANGF